MCSSDLLNAIDSRTEGVDIVSTYTLNTSDYGAFNFNAGANFNDNEVTNVIDAPDVLQNAGFDQANLFDDVELRRSRPRHIRRFPEWD